MADIELALPDPAAIWRELGDFQSAVDSYVRQQTELADCLRRSHLDFCQDQKNKLETLDSQKKKTLHAIEVLTEEKRKEAEELDRMRQKASKLERQATKDLPDKLKEYKHLDEEQQKRTRSMRLVVEKQERASRLEMTERKQELKAYEQGLGLKIRRRSNGEICFVFTHVDDKDVEAPFEFTIAPTQANSSDYSNIRLVSCLPTMDAAANIVSNYNKSKRDADKFSLLVRCMRAAFRATLSK